MKKTGIIIGVIVAVIAVAIGGIFLTRDKNKTEENPSESIAQSTENISADNYIPSEKETEAVLVEKTTGTETKPSESVTESTTKVNKTTYVAEKETSTKPVSNGKAIDLKAVNLSKYGISADYEISKPRSVKYGNVYLVRDYFNEYLSRTYVFVTTNKDIVYIDTGWEITKDISLKWVDLYTVDLDGNGGEEIILNMDLGGSGGAGSFASFIYKFSDGKIVEMKQPDEAYETTGFTAEFKAPFKMVVTNENVDKKIVVDAKNDECYTDSFDGEGNPISECDLFCDSFYEFKPIKLKDSSYGVKRVQYAWIDTHVNGLGDAVTVIKYNSDSDQFEVIDADFVAW